MHASNPLERISSIDVLRGFALLGILLMNIQDFGLPEAAYGNPTVWGGAEGPNLAYWFANQVFFEGKMRAIFSMLFGASFLVITGRAEARGAGVEMADAYFRRTLWLILFGLLHAYLIWRGDILFYYGCVGLMLFPLRHLQPKTLLIAGFSLVLLGVPGVVAQGLEFNQIRDKGVAAIAKERSGKALSKAEQKDKEKWEEKLKSAKPDPAEVRKEVNEMRLGYWPNLEKRAKFLFEHHGQWLYTWGWIDAGSMMLTGMGLFKLGVFHAGLPPRVYWLMILLGYGIGVPLNAYAAWDSILTKWDPSRGFWWGWCTYDLGRLAVAFGHIGLVMLVLCQWNWFGFLARRLASVGQMALSNYLLTSVLMTFFFNGYGLGMFGKLERHQLLYVAGGMWLINLVMSPWWQRWFNYGPVEWFWRWMTYLRRPTLRKALPAAATLASVMLLAGCMGKHQNFEPFREEFVYTSLGYSPTAATSAGFHRFASELLDEKLDDFSPTSIGRQKKFYREWRENIAQLAYRDRLEKQDLADLDLLLNEAARQSHDLEVIESYRHNPLKYTGVIGEGLFAPYSLEWAPKDSRYYFIIRRLEGVAKLLAAARFNLRDSPAPFTEAAIAANQGNIAMIDRTLREDCPPSLRERYDSTAAPALAELRAFDAWLRTDLAARASDWRLGPEKYARKFEYTLATGDTPETLLAAAEADLARFRQEMEKIAGAEGVKPMLDRIARKHSARENYFRDAEAYLAEAKQFALSAKLLGIPETRNLRVIETPVYQRGAYGVGGFNPPPALHPELGAQYWITPIPADWPPARIESKLREYNDYGLRLLTVHEAMPGHYVQFEYANRIEPRSRRVLYSRFGSGTYVEGWAVYITEEMLNAGYLNRSPELRLTFLKQQLRVVANAILDIKLHTKGMTDKEALRLMTQDAYQEEEEARAKLQRAKLTSCQLPTYYAGWKAFRRLRERHGAADAKAFHEKVLRLGALPVPLLERLL